MRSQYDVIVVGAGIIGASAAWHASKYFATALVEQESAPGYHSSGRSAAVLLPSYGGSLAQALTAASRAFLENAPSGFCESNLTQPRGALFIAAGGQAHLLDRWIGTGAMSARGVQTLRPSQAVDRVPILREERIERAVFLPEVVDIDAMALLHGYIRSFRTNGGQLYLDAKVGGIRRSAGEWIVETPAGSLRGKVLVNAAGAWADSIAELAEVTPKGLVPTRRTMVVIKAPDATDVSPWPLVADADEAFYFKPEAGRLALSPADRTVVQAADILPDELDVAVGIDRFETATTMTVTRVEHRWAGLRTFTPDDEPIIGFDPAVPDFLWAAGFGGFGVQASFATGLCCEALLRQRPPDASLGPGLDLARLSPQRLSGIRR